MRSNDARPYVATSKALTEHLSKLGHTVDTVIVSDLAKDFRKRVEPTDAIVAVGTTAATWVRARMRPTDKLIYCMVAGSGTVDMKGGNVTGITTDVPVAAQFALIRRALPKAKTVGMLFSSDNDKSRGHLANAKAALPKGLRIISVDIAKHKSRAAAISALLAMDIDIVWTCPDPAVCNPQTVRFLLLSALKAKIPVFGFSEGFVRIGALLGVGVRPAAQAAQAAELANRVLCVAAGASETAITPPPTDYMIAVNLILAERIGVVLPAPLIEAAGTVFRPKPEGSK